MMSQDYNKPVSTAALGDANLAWQQGDLNNDGVVDFNDMAIMAQNYNTGQLLTSDAPDDGASFGALTPVIPSANTTTATVAAALVSTTSNTTTTPAKTKAPRPIHKPTAFSLKLVARPRTVHPVAVVRKI
jgi:hypothetical protein